LISSAWTQGEEEDAEVVVRDVVVAVVRDVEVAVVRDVAVEVVVEEESTEDEYDFYQVYIMYFSLWLIDKLFFSMTFHNDSKTAILLMLKN
jgi:hypothetical protein